MPKPISVPHEVASHVFFKALQKSSPSPIPHKEQHRRSAILLALAPLSFLILLYLRNPYIPTMTDPSPPRRGDKFAALQQQQHQAAAAPKRDKFAAMQSRSENETITVSGCSPQEVVDSKHAEASKLQNKKFSKVWSDLQLAEAATLRLLRVARDTAESLIHADTLDPDNPQQDAPPIDDFVTTLQQVHSLLSPHAHFVKAYQAPTEPNKTYLAKVELGMARQKRNVIQAWNKLLQEQEQDGENKDGRGDVVSIEEIGSKRKRDD